MAKSYDIPDINRRFWELFKWTKLSQAEFGTLLGLSQNQVSNIILGKSLVTPMLIELFQYKLNVNPRWLLEGEPPMFRENPELPNESIPILADIPAGDWKFWIDSYPAKAGEGYICVPEMKGANLFAIRVRGDSMEPSLHEGDILVINPYREFFKGLAVVRHHWGYKIRTVRKLNHSYLLTPYNPAYDEEVIDPDDDTRFYVPVKRISMQDLPEGG